MKKRSIAILKEWINSQRNLESTHYHMKKVIEVTNEKRYFKMKPLAEVK